MRAPCLSLVLVLVPSLVLAQAAPAPAAAPPDSHTVERGDTLWDLSAKYLENPWVWPKVWSFNPQIQNPHWIYPGNVVRLRPAKDDEETASGDATEENDGEGEPAGELEDLSRAEMNQPLPPGHGDAVTVGGPYRIGQTAARRLPVRRESFVTQRQIQESGSITAAFEDKLLLSMHDRAYARFADLSKVEPGQVVVLYRPEREIRHPVTGQPFGWKTNLVGSARVLAVDSTVATIEIAQSAAPIERGTLVGPWTEAALYRVTPRPNGHELKGYIVAAQRDVSSVIGESQVVFVDRGRTDGVEEGNAFTVVRAGDPSTEDPMKVAQEASVRSSLPNEDIGLLFVVDVQEKSSTALVVRSNRELLVGDKVEMRKASAKR